MKNNCIIFLLLLSFSTIGVFGKNLDSLKSKLNNASGYEEQIELLRFISHEYFLLSLHDSVMKTCYKGLSIAEKHNQEKLKIDFYDDIALTNEAIGNYSEALNYLFKALKIAKKEGLKKQSSEYLNSIANIYWQNGDKERAEEIFKESMQIAIEINDIRLLAKIYNGLGILNMMRWEYDSGVYYWEESVKLKTELGDEQGAAITLSNLAIYYTDIKETAKAIEYFKKSENIHTKNKNYEALSSVLVNTATLYIKRNADKKAISILKEALKYAKIANSPKNRRLVYLNLAESYYNLHQYREAMDNYMSYMSLNDSLESLNKQDQIAEMQAKYESDKKNLEIEKLTNEKRAQNAEIIAKEEEAKRQQIQIIALVAGSLLLVLIAIILYRQFKRKQKDHDLISVQKEKLQEQKLVVEEKNQEITDSINYAKRIQDAILPPLEILKTYFPESFVFFKPKDVVSGDFYWMTQVPPTLPSDGGEGQILFAVADCTGHGVPGAMVSVVCNNALNRAVNEFQLSEPAKILDKVNELVDESFATSHIQVQDGMDITLVSLPLTTSKKGVTNIQYAGANNPLWIIKSSHSPNLPKEEGVISHSMETAGMFEVKPDKQPIGSHSNRKPFTNQTIKLEKGDAIYLFSDGYADQFGGEKGKKLKYRPFRRILLSIQNQSLEKQGEILAQKFDEWKGGYEQVDDVSVVGIKV